MLQTGNILPNKNKNKKVIDKNNANKNKSRLDHHYKVGDQILLRARKTSKHDEEYEGPYPLTKVNTKWNSQLSKRNYK